MDFIYTVEIVNSRDIEVSFDLEPWGDQFRMPPGARFTVVASAPERGILEVKIEEKCITVFGWVGSIVQVYQDGMEVGGAAPPIPPTPKIKT